MGKRVDPNLRISQRGIGLHKYQWEFIDNPPEGWSLDVWARKNLDKEIELLKPELLYDKETMDFPGEKNE